MSFDFSYTRDTTPSPKSACVIWRKSKDKITGEEYIAMDANLAYLDCKDGRCCWKILSTDEVLNNQDVVKYIEIPIRFWGGVIKKGNILDRLNTFFHGMKYVEKELKYKPKLYQLTFKRKVRCDQFSKKED